MTTPATQEAAHAADTIDRLMVHAEAAWGYRGRLERLGFSPAVAEQVAMVALLRMNAELEEPRRRGRRGRRGRRRESM